ncbi:L,D-transpeptidase family protein [Oceanobacillus limi]|nr:L,D-transpeptidase family protein [Oceanobacillus limi]
MSEGNNENFYLPRSKRHKRQRNNFMIFLLFLLIALLGIVLWYVIQMDEIGRSLPSHAESSIKEPKKKQGILEEVETLNLTTISDQKRKEENGKKEANSSEKNEEVTEQQQTTPIDKEISADYVLEHTVKEGETLYSITMLYFSDSSYQEQIKLYNNITNPAKEIQVGMQLNIPDPDYMIEHTIKQGESLIGISRKYYNTDAYTGALAKYNDLQNPDHLPFGTAIHIPSPSLLEKDVPVQGSRKSSEASVETSSFSIRINKKTNQLTVFQNGDEVRSFSVGTGKDVSMTPEGDFNVVNKIEEPWYSSKGIPGGHPDNPLGSRWIGLNVPGTDGTVYGIHGTNDPTSIGGHVSLGCIRMLNEDVEWLYNQIPIGTPVTIE